jgi:clan AA aspartic protease (TIGR02281 family)
MIKRALIIFTFIVFLAWLTQDYFSITLPSQKTNSHKKDSLKTIPTKNALTLPTHSQKSNTTKETYLTLSKLLEQHRFYDAMAYYLEYTSVGNLKQIESYLTSLASTNPSLALEYMQAFLDSVPESSVLTLMITTYIAEGNLPKAIELIIQAKENYISEEEDKRLTNQLKNVAIKHIDTLLDRREYAQLIAFLEEMIAYDSEDNFYKFRLAQLYMKLDKVEEAGVILDVLQYDEVYAQNVKTLLSSIDTQEDESYEYAISLQQYGDHYTVNVLLDGNTFNLMLDTGATYILLDEVKADALEVVRDDLVLQTVGNNISAKLANVSTMQMGNLTLSNTQVTLAPFQRNGIDGLLGMNFFKQFRFFINQEEGVLYLNPK